MLGTVPGAEKTLNKCSCYNDDLAFWRALIPVPQSQSQICCFPQWALGPLCKSASSPPASVPEPQMGTYRYINTSVLSIYCVPGTVLSDLHGLSHSLPTERL